MKNIKNKIKDEYEYFTDSLFYQCYHTIPVDNLGLFLWNKIAMGIIIRSGIIKNYIIKPDIKENILNQIKNEKYY